MLKAHQHSEECTVLVLKGREVILGHADLLEAFASRCDQDGAMNWLAYFLNGGGAKLKSPYLVLLVAPEGDAQHLAIDDLRGAALFFEYCVGGLGTGAFSIDDSAGIRTVVAPQGRRAEVAALAVAALIQREAHVILASYEGSSAARDEAAPRQIPRNALWAKRKRVIGKFLPLQPTLEDTLASLGKITRRNLRYYRRRLVSETGCEFVADARLQLRKDDLIGLNMDSLNPFDQEELQLRWQSACELPGGYLMGLRDRQGRWLSLIGGWRQGTTTVVHWQMNAQGYEKISIGTGMRSFFLEHEVERGARKLIFYGGTPHSIQHSFEEGPVWDLVMRRRSLRAALIGKLALLVSSPQGITGRMNFLAQALRSGELQWNPALPHQKGHVASSVHPGGRKGLLRRAFHREFQGGRD